MRGIVKRFPGVVANDGVDFDVRVGEIHALLGENGAGKSTLMSVLSGLYAPDEGRILLDGAAVAFRDPRDAIGRGIGMVHQHFMLVPTLTVAENIMLGAETTRNGFLDYDAVHGRIATLAERHGLAVDPNALIRDLPVGVQQRVEIVKALYRSARILVLDEPTGVLTPGEADELFTVVRALAKAGTAIVFITHKLREVLALADRVTVLRDGRVIGTVAADGATEQSLAAMMVGREVELHVKKTEPHPGDTRLRVEGLRVIGDRGAVAVDGVTFAVRAGEIVGIAGVEGNGQSELVETLTGLRRPIAGSVHVDDLDVTGEAPHPLFERGIAHIPEDRHKHGLVLSYPLADNLVLSSYYRPPFAECLRIIAAQIYAFAERVAREFDIRVPSVATLASALSGGNQQKAVVAREFSRQPRILIAAQPTRGVDIGSVETIHRRLIAARDAGTAILLVSAELDEVMGLADRILVMYRGRVVADRDADAYTREEIGMFMAGAGA
ncbi:MAG: ABC transporter ATP-binding protein [Chloroflexota bacterium]|nr:MAG: ABC transporter ATP-binding protein [Chloroflexota bacterium]